MTKKVIWSHRSIFITVIATGILVAGMICCRDDASKYNTLAVILAAMLLAKWYWSPISIELNDQAIIVKKRISRKTIPYYDIESVSSFIPMSWLTNQRVVGSGGYAGYWGWFKDPQIGIYFGYYGESSNCFLIRLKNGRQYVIGCEDSKSVIDYISKKIS